MNDPPASRSPYEGDPPGRLGAPAWGTIVAGLVQFAFGALMTVGMYMAFFVEDPTEVWEDAELPPGFSPEFMSWAMVLMFGGLTATGGVMIAGGIAALRRGRWWLALAGAVTAIALNGMFLCPIGPIFGIWLIVRLLQPEIRESFANQTPAVPIEADESAWR